MRCRKEPRLPYGYQHYEDSAGMARQQESRIPFRRCHHYILSPEGERIIAYRFGHDKFVVRYMDDESEEFDSCPEARRRISEMAWGHWHGTFSRWHRIVRVRINEWAVAIALVLGLAGFILQVMPE